MDLAGGTASFYVQFDRTPDLLTVDQYDRQADSFQYWVDSVAPDAIGRTYAGILGQIPLETQTVISAREIPFLGDLELIHPMLLGAPGPRDRGGWGQVVGHVTYSLDTDNTLRFIVPLSLLRDDDGVFYYSFVTVSYGDGGLTEFDGVSGMDYILPVPEPAPFAMLAGGLAVLAAARRRRGAA